MNGRDRRWAFRPHFSRRELLGKLGLTAAAAPFVPLLDASAADARPPKRLILFYTPHGTVWDRWAPTGAGTSFQLSPILAPLEKHKQRIAVLAGMQILAPGVGAPHTKGLPLLWTASPLLEDMTFTREDGSGGKYFGWNSAASVDQIIAARVGTDTPFRSLELGVRSGGSHPASRMIYSGAKQPLAPEGNPAAMFDRLFGMNQSATDLAKLRAKRKSSLDLVATELDALVARTPSADRPKVQRHLDAVRTLEKQLFAQGAACTPPPKPATLDAGAVANIPTVVQRQIDLMVAALACDLTRVASFQYRIGDNDNDFYDWIGITREGHHLITHGGDTDVQSQDDLTKIYTWYSDRFAYLLDRLASVREGDGTLLDNTIVVWGSELGKGNTHSFERTPFVVAGGGGGTIRTGQLLTLDGTPHNRLLVAVCQAMGLPDVQSFGATDPGKGPLPGLLA
jgi:hypothetical protein